VRSATRWQGHGVREKGLEASQVIAETFADVVAQRLERPSDKGSGGKRSAEVSATPEQGKEGRQCLAGPGGSAEQQAASRGKHRPGDTLSGCWPAEALGEPLPQRNGQNRQGGLVGGARGHDFRVSARSLPYALRRSGQTGFIPTVTPHQCSVLPSERKLRQGLPFRAPVQVNAPSGR